MNSKRLAILAMVLLTVPLTASADRIQSTTSVHLTFRQCIAGATACDSIGPSQASKSAGLPGDLAAAASQADPAYGESVGSAKLTDAPAAAELNARVTSLPATRNGSNSIVLKRYTNEAVATQTLTVESTLTYEQVVPPENAGFPADAPSRSGAFAEFVIFTSDANSFEAGTTAEDNFAALMSEEDPDIGFAVLESARATPARNVSEAGTEVFSRTVTLNPGDSIWLMAILQSIAANGAAVDADLVIDLGWAPEQSAADQP